jgi:hypothetical protein
MAIQLKASSDHLHTRIDSKNYTVITAFVKSLHMFINNFPYKC